MMKLKRVKLLVLPLAMLLFLSFSSAHKFYLSVTNIVYSEDDSAFQITSRIFIDDLDRLLNERYGVEANLATPKESKIADEYIGKYFRSKFVVELDGEIVPYTFLGKRYDKDVVICYLEIPNVELSEVKSMSVQNEVLMDLFDEQKNVVHVKWEDNKRSFVLIRENNKGMLNL
ncbi:DUF6702 family protein [Flagellimonas oceanensis]|uniref:DUF6702 family protein n=1 Tax=Flagellimonas oceanensis TaxID=2499163 RepID=UPI000F8C4DBC|nr:DUF6702 family protein [Allomuricauda oceanensis]|tara:strand:- start:3244 stop:3762 length:519 start_codon:yes stop_codon:yes gene_type:complete